MKLAPKQKQLVKEYIQKLQSKKLNELNEDDVNQWLDDYQEKFEILRETCLKDYDKYMQAWKRKWYPKLVKLANSGPEEDLIDAEQAWSEIADDARTEFEW